MTARLRSNSHKNSGIDNIRQPTDYLTGTQRTKTSNPIPQTIYTIDDSNLTEDEEPVNTEIRPRSKSLSSSPTKKLSTPSKQQQNLSCLTYFKFKYVFIVLIIILGIGVLLSFLNNHTTKTAGNDMKSDPVTDNDLNPAMLLIDEMEHSFPLQKDETWSSFLSALTSVLRQVEPSQPAVLLLVGGHTLIETQTMQCVALTLANNTNKLFPPMNSVNVISSEITVQVGKFVHLQNPETIKKELDAQMRSILDKSYSVVVGPLEKIPPEAALLLHGYCDNFEAPFKKRVIILTATFHSDKPLNSKQLERRLNTLWDPELGEDQSASIISRIANNVVFIEPETGPMPCSVLV